MSTGDPCLGGPECANVCDDGADTCDVPAGTACTDDGNVWVSRDFAQNWRRITEGLPDRYVTALAVVDAAGRLLHGRAIDPRRTNRDILRLPTGGRMRAGSAGVTGTAATSVADSWGASSPTLTR